MVDYFARGLAWTAMGWLWSTGPTGWAILDGTLMAICSGFAVVNTFLSVWHKW